MDENYPNHIDYLDNDMEQEYGYQEDSNEYRENERDNELSFSKNEEADQNRKVSEFANIALDGIEGLVNMGSIIQLEYLKTFIESKIDEYYEKN